MIEGIEGCVSLFLLTPPEYHQHTISHVLIQTTSKEAYCTLQMKFPSRYGGGLVMFELSSADLAQILHVKCMMDTYLVYCAGGKVI